MGTAVSLTYKNIRNLVIRYNAENRAHKFLEKGKLPSAPRHPTKKDEIQLLNEKPHVIKELQELNVKNPQLDDYLKKVYLTSTSSEEKLMKPSRPLPVKREFDLTQMFYEPDKPCAGFCSLTNVFDMLIKHQSDPMKWSMSNLAEHYNMNKDIVVKLLTNYSLIKVEEFQFMNQVKEEEISSMKKTDELENIPQLEKKPLQYVEGKK